MRKIVINSQERAVSTDINRLQSFARRDLEEILRYEFLGTLVGPSDPGNAAYPVTVATPMKAEILGGLLVKPQNGTLDLLVDPGSLVAVSPDATLADSSSCVAVIDNGVPLVGTLAIGANASGSTRIDVVECRINPVPDVATDNRDKFDETTGLFSAVTVTKELGDRLEYRVRAGTPGAGYPAAQVGWLPLCVAKVPTGTTTNATVTFWDVRPLASDRVNTLRASSNFVSELLDLDGTCTRVSGTSCLLGGAWRAQIGGRELASPFIGGLGTYQATSWDAGDTANQDSGAIAESLTGHVYIYACTPFGLPRWAMYAPTGSRVPGSCGILVASYTAPDEGRARPSASITLPAGCGLGGAAAPAEAACVSVIPRTAGNAFSNWVARNRSVRTQVDGRTVVSGAAGVFAVGFFDWNVDATFWFPNAKSLDVVAITTITVPNATLVQGITNFRVANGAGPATISKSNSVPYSLPNHSGGAVGMSVSMEGRLHQPWNGLSPAIIPRLILGMVPSATPYGTPPTLTGVTATIAVAGFTL